MNQDKETYNYQTTISLQPDFEYNNELIIMK